VHVKKTSCLPNLCARSDKIALDKEELSTLSPDPDRSTSERTQPFVSRLAPIILLLLALFVPVAAMAEPMAFHLAWDPSATEEVTGYFVYVGTEPGVFAEFIDVGLVTNYVYPGDTRNRYFFAIRAYRADGKLSLISNLALTNAWPTLHVPGTQSSPMSSSVVFPLIATDPEELPLIYTVTGLPPGLAVSATGVVTGVPTEMGTYTVEVLVLDAAGNQDRGTFSWSITPPLPVTPIPLLPAPLSLIPTRTPIYAWTLSPGADGYFVLSIDSAGVVRESVYGLTSCYVTYCAVYGETLAAGAAVWAVAAYNISGESPASVPVPFAVVRPPLGDRANVASAAQGGTAVVSSQYDPSHAPEGVLDGDRRGVNWGINGGWRSARPEGGVSAEWIEVRFASAAMVNEIDVFGLHDALTAPTDPTESMPASLFALQDFQLQWDYGGEWRPIEGAFVVDNDKVWRRLTFPAIFTTRIRLVITRTVDDSVRLAEIEAWGVLTAPPNTGPSVSLTSPMSGLSVQSSSPIGVTATASDSDGVIAQVDLLINGVVAASDTTSPYSFQLAPLPVGAHTVVVVAHDDVGATATSNPVTVNVMARANFALASNQAVAVASSTLPGGFAASGAIDGDRRAPYWGAHDGWSDGTANVHNDWLEVRFPVARMIEEVNVIGLQDDWAAGVEPTSQMQGSLFGLRDFRIEYLSGYTWRTVTNGVITGNTLVWRRITFPPVSTSRIRIVITRPVGAYSRVVELEAWGAP
jgi:hypothetical protein